VLFVKKKLFLQYLNGYIYIKWYMDKKFENRKNLKTEKGITCKISLNGHANIYMKLKKIEKQRDM
jgi:hypothetical protein